MSVRFFLLLLSIRLLLLLFLFICASYCWHGIQYAMGHVALLVIFLVFEYYSAPQTENSKRNSSEGSSCTDDVNPFQVAY